MPANGCYHVGPQRNAAPDSIFGPRGLPPARAIFQLRRCGKTQQLFPCYHGAAARAHFRPCTRGREARASGSVWASCYTAASTSSVRAEGLGVRSLKQGVALRRHVPLGKRVAVAKESPALREDGAKVVEVMRLSGRLESLLRRRPILRACRRVMRRSR